MRQKKMLNMYTLIIKASMPTKFVSQYLDPLYILSVLMAINKFLRQRMTVGKQVVGEESFQIKDHSKLNGHIMPSHESS